MKPKVIYIMGCGHSGSTVLDIVLGNHPEIESVGELYKLQRSGWTQDMNRRCACGKPIHYCPYWTAIHECWQARIGEASLESYIGLQALFENSRFVWPRLLSDSKWQSAKFAEYAKMTAALYQAICDVSGKEVIVDSSKSPIRAYGLSINDNIDFYLIHLVRDGRGVMWSKLKPRQKNVEAGIPKTISSVAAWRTSLDWIAKNLESEWIVARTRPERTLRVVYEQFVRDPDTVLGEIEALVSKDFSQVARALSRREALPVGHNVAGNHLRMTGSLVLRPDMEWGDKLSANKQRVFWSLGGWLARRYGYQKCDTSPNPL
jgi:hypothetical protein